MLIFVTNSNSPRRLIDGEPSLSVSQKGYQMFKSYRILSLEDAKEKIRLFKKEYNGFRPHSSLSGLTPNEVVQQHSHGPIFPTLAGREIGRSSGSVR